MSEQTGLPESLSLQKVDIPDNCAIFAPHAGFTMPSEYLAKLSTDFAGDSIALFDQTDWATAIATHGVNNTVPSPGHRFAGDPNRDPEAGETTFVMERSFGGRSIWDIYPTKTEIIQQRASRERYHTQCCELVSGLVAKHNQVLVVDAHDTSDWRNTPDGWQLRTEFADEPTFSAEGYPAFVIGTLDGQSASEAVSKAFAEQLVSACQQFGVQYRGRPVILSDVLFDVHNKGGYATKRMGLILPESIQQHGKGLGRKTAREAANSLHVLQVEANRDDITGVDARTQRVDLQKAHSYRLALQTAITKTASMIDQWQIEDWRPSAGLVSNGY